MRANPKLLPCPFCGGVAEYSGNHFVIRCSRCWAFMRSRTGEPHDALLIRWNRRTYAVESLQTAYNKPSTPAVEADMQS